MERISHASDLSRVLRQKLEDDRLQIEALTSSELSKLADALKQQSHAALSTTLDAIESDLNQRLNGIKKQIEAQTKPLVSHLASVRAEASALQRLTVRAWLKPLLLSLSLSLGIFAGSWGLMQWLSHGIQSQLETRAALAQEIQRQKRVLAQIESKTWGLELHEDSNGRFVIMPPGVEPSIWKFGQGEAVRLGVRLGKN